MKAYEKDFRPYFERGSFGYCTDCRGGSGAGVSFSGAAGASEPASVSGSAVNSSVYGTTLADIQAKGELVIGLDDTFAPMGFRDESGNLVGFDIDLATAVCEELGVKGDIPAY